MNNKTINKGRIAYIEAIRCIALFFVVLAHVVAIPVQKWSGETGVEYGLYVICYAIGNFGVPLFLMITGTLLLQRDKNITLDKLFHKMLPRILVPLVVWGFIFACLEIYFETHSINFSMIPDAVLRVLNKESWGHLWYLYMLIGVYLFLPVLKVMANNLSEKFHLYLCIVLFILGYVFPQINILFGTTITVNAPLPLCHFACVWYGYCINRFGDRKRVKQVIYGFGTISILVLVIFSLFSGHGQYSVLARYDGPFVVGASALIYLVVFQLLKDGQIPKILLLLADCSFGIYLLHPVIMNVLYKVVKLQPTQFPALISIPICALIFIIPTWLGVAIAKKIPFIRKLV